MKFSEKNLIRMLSHKKKSYDFIDFLRNPRPSQRRRNVHYSSASLTLPIRNKLFFDTSFRRTEEGRSSRPLPALQELQQRQCVPNDSSPAFWISTYGKATNDRSDTLNLPST